VTEKDINEVNEAEKRCKTQLASLGEKYLKLLQPPPMKEKI